MTFSEFVISVRKKLKLSQKQLAAAINVSYSTINRWENDHVVPSNLAVKSFYDFVKTILLIFLMTYCNATCQLSLEILGGK